MHYFIVSIIAILIVVMPGSLLIVSLCAGYRLWKRKKTKRIIEKSICVLKTINDIDAIFLSGDAIYAIVLEHTDSIYEKVVDAEGILMDHGIHVDIHVWAHQGRDSTKMVPHDAKLVWSAKGGSNA
jgi:hypothetical protein